MPLNQGREANRTGNLLEQQVQLTLESIGYHTCQYTDNADTYDWEKPRRLIRNVPFTSIYGCQARSEFVAENRELARRCRIECKWQGCAGSVDEKFAYLYLNAMEAMPENEIVIVIGGDGYRTAALNWLKNTVTARKYINQPDKRIYVFSLEEFINWAGKNL